MCAQVYSEIQTTVVFLRAAEEVGLMLESIHVSRALGVGGSGV